ncbi:MAG: phosphodiester glycosidase family protein [Planctomycetota bacterium]|nr:phosphodiester glycosidase family protein [Planctomycetota bacterium]
MIDNWYASCAAFSKTHKLGLIPIIDAFGGPSTGLEAPFEKIESQATVLAPTVGERIPESLPTIDPAQAALFGRRFISVCQLLTAMDQIESRVLFVGLVARMDEVLNAPPPRALRVRAICDFYYSQTARIHHRGSTRTLADVVAKTSWTKIAKGVRHATLTEKTQLGPVNINVLAIAPGGRIRTIKCGDQSLLELMKAHGAVAGVSGGFFLYSEPDIEPPSHRNDPVGLLVDTDILPPSLRRSAVVQRDGHFDIEIISMLGVELDFGTETVIIQAVNDPSAIGQVPVTFNRAYGESVAGGHQLAIIGSQVVDSKKVPLAGFLLVTPKAVSHSGTVSYRMPGPPLQAAMAGGPWLTPGLVPDLLAEDFTKSAPPQTFSQDETFDENLLPRMAAGITESGELIFCAIDGRNFDKAPGFTLRMCADLMSHFACVKAMNLDGGSSKRMIIGDRVVDLSSTEVISGKNDNKVSIRAIRTGIMVFGRDSQSA